MCYEMSKCNKRDREEGKGSRLRETKRERDFAACNVKNKHMKRRMLQNL